MERRSCVVAAAVLLVGLVAWPARASHRVDEGWVDVGVSSEEEARAYPCPRTAAGGWERTGPVVCLDKQAPAWELWSASRTGCTYDITGWHGDCVFDLDMGDHLRVWGTRGVVSVRFTVTWLHDVTPSPDPSAAPPSPEPTAPPSSVPASPTPSPRARPTPSGAAAPAPPPGPGPTVTPVEAATPVPTPPPAEPGAAATPSTTVTNTDEPAAAAPAAPPPQDRGGSTVPVVVGGLALGVGAVALVARVRRRRA